VHLPQPQNPKKKQPLTHFFYLLFSRILFIAFLGVSQQGEFKNAIIYFHKKIQSGLITKNVAFSPSVFFPPPSVVLLDFFIAFLGVS
jgi:hypothetical protein